MFSAISLFSGVGMLDLGFSKAGFDILAQVEIDPFCRDVLRKHEKEYWPNAQRFTDVRTVGAGNLPAVDVIFGGFPCQDISSAGKGKGITKETRSGLWFEFARIIGELRPRFVMLENVPAIAGRGGTLVVAMLTALGYDCEWRLISAADCGAPHERKRWWCVAYPQSQRGSVECGEWENRRQSLGSGVRGRLWSELTDGGQDVVNNHNTLSTRKNDPVCAGWNADHHASQTMVNSAESGLSISRSSGESTSATESRTGMDREFERSDRSLVISHGTGLQSTRSQREARSANSGANTTPIRTSAGETQSRLGRAAYGVTRWVDGHFWPAGQGIWQKEGEAPRIVSEKIPDRAARIKALGNGAMWMIAYEIALQIKEVLEDENKPYLSGECGGCSENISR